MFWSGADFDDPRLAHRGKKFKDASIYFPSLNEVDKEALADWLKKSREIQWDYKNLAKRKGQLLKIDRNSGPQ